MDFDLFMEPEFLEEADVEEQFIELDEDEYTNELSDLTPSTSTESAIPQGKRFSAAYVKRKIENGIWRLVTLKGYSMVARYFSKLEGKNAPKNIFVCNICFVSYSNQSRTHCTNHMYSNHPEIEITSAKEYKSQVFNCCIKKAVQDSHPLLLVNNKRFKNFVQEIGDLAISINKKGQEYDASALIPNPSTISMLIDSALKKCSSGILPKIFNTMKTSGCALTLDFLNKKYDFLVITSHFIENWNLRTFVLSFTPFTEMHLKTSENIRKDFLSIMYNYGFSESVTKEIGVVTDERINIKKAFSDYDKYLCCSCHILNDCSKTTLEPCVNTDLQPTTVEKLNQFFNKIVLLRSFITKARRKGALLNDLGDSLCLPAENCWLSNAKMVNKFVDNYDLIRNSINVIAPEFIAPFDQFEPMISDFVIYNDFNKEFLSALKELESDKIVTISSVVPVFANLIQTTKSLLNDEPKSLIECLAASALEALKRKLSTFNFWLPLVAAFLDPFVKAQLPEIAKVVPQWNADMAYSLTTHKLQGFITRNNILPKNVLTSRKRHFEVSAEDTVILEVKKYNAISDFHGTSLQFWEQNEQFFPRLSKFAKSILCIPASSAPSEGVCSTLGLAATELRDRLTPERTSQMIMLKSLLKNNFLEMSDNSTLHTFLNFVFNYFPHHK